MDDKKKKATAASQEAKKGPVKTFTAQDVSASIFSREHNGRTYYSVTFTRWYRDSKGQNRYINSFGLEDLGKVITVAQQADEYIRSLTSPEIA
jgi:hypothetical protein